MYTSLVRYRSMGVGIHPIENGATRGWIRAFLS